MRVRVSGRLRFPDETHYVIDVDSLELLPSDTVAEDAPRRLTTEQARALALAALPGQQQLRGVQAVNFDAPADVERYLSVSVIWDNPEGSVTAGNYGIDLFTGDVFDLAATCLEYDDPALRKLQARTRKVLRLSDADYRRLKTNGPFCE